MSYAAHSLLPVSSSSSLPSTPPAPPPKPSASSTPTIRGPPQPPPPPPPPSRPVQIEPSELDAGQARPAQNVFPQLSVPAVESNWLPAVLRDKSTQDLQHILSNPPLQTALLSHPQTTHPALTSTQAALEPLIATNLDLCTAVLALDARVSRLRQRTQSRLLALRALEQQHRGKLGETDAALREFSPRALYQRLSASVLEQEQVLRGVEESWLEEDEGAASEREVAEFVRRVKEGKKMAFLRLERRNRWDEARVGGWR